MRFSFSTLYVRDLEESLAFYEGVLGLSVSRRFPAGPDVEIAFLGEAGSEIELICDKNRESYEVGKDVSWGFAVEDLEFTLTELKDHGLPITDVLEPQPGVRFFFTEDPNGLRIQLIEHPSSAL